MRRRDLLEVIPAMALVATKAASAPPMKVVRLETFYWKNSGEAPWWPHWTWVRIHTDSGLVGLGETYPRNSVQAEAIHAHIAPAVLGKDPRDIERIWHDLHRNFDFQVTGGTEMRILSALDLALWDLLGKSLGVPVYRLLGGLSNRRIRVYNTCFPLRYDFLKEPEKIMREIIEKHGITTIKIWPFDGAARRNNCQFITPADIEEALQPVRRLRDAFAERIEILIECHSLWNLTAAIRIAKALEPYRPLWVEDMLMPGHYRVYRELAQATNLPLAVGERMAGKMQFEELMESRVAKFIMFDVCWCGGITESRKITAMADAHQLPFAPHTAGGPLLFYASTHLSAAMPNCWIQESCQRFYENDWPLMLVDPIVPRSGHVEPPDGPGFGMQVRPEVWNDPSVIRRESVWSG